MNRQWSIFIGFDPREADAFAVACASIASRLTIPIPTYGLVLSDLQASGLYTRPTDVRVSPGGRRQLIDVLSRRADYDGAMSTEFAVSRFLTKFLAREGLALFLDADMLARRNLARAFEAVEATPGKALYCVKHDHRPTETVKMDGQAQTQYPRKNWSSFFIIDCDHAANGALTLDLINTMPGRDLHRFCWLADEEIGDLGPEWNHLVGHSPPIADPAVVHFTDGVPSMAGYENVAFADEWRKTLAFAARSAMGSSGYRR